MAVPTKERPFPEDIRQYLNLIATFSANHSLHSSYSSTVLLNRKQYGLKTNRTGNEIRYLGPTELSPVRVDIRLPFLEYSLRMP